MALKMYAYKNCNTCRQAQKWLAERNIACEVVPIREQPPTVAELKKALDRCGGDRRRLFNTSGADYRAMDMKTRLPQMMEEEVLALLSSNGNLVKRPLIIGDDVAMTGFDREQWAAAEERLR